MTNSWPLNEKYFSERTVNMHCESSNMAILGYPVIIFCSYMYSNSNLVNLTFIGFNFYVLYLIIMK